MLFFQRRGAAELPCRKIDAPAATHTSDPVFTAAATHTTSAQAFTVADTEIRALVRRRSDFECGFRIADWADDGGSSAPRSMPGMMSAEPRLNCHRCEPHWHLTERPIHLPYKFGPPQADRSTKSETNSNLRMTRLRQGFHLRQGYDATSRRDRAE
jgi:hypothetical protein